jgi:hypothetical protein
MTNNSIGGWRRRSRSNYNLSRMLRLSYQYTNSNGCHDPVDRNTRLLGHLSCKQSKNKQLNCKYGDNNQSEITKVGSFIPEYSMLCAQSSDLGSDTYFGVFQTVLLLHKSWCKIGQTGAISAQVLAMKSCQNLSQRTHPIHPIRP